MFDGIVLSDWLVDLPLIGRLPIWRTRKVDSPVRSVEAVDWVYWGKGLMDGPQATIYRAEFMDGVTREIIVEGDPLHRDFDTAFFLRPGRKNNQLGHIAKFIIREPEDAVPDAVKEALRAYEAGRDRDLTAGQCNCG